MGLKKQRRVYRVSYLTAGPGDWLQRCLEAHSAGMTAAESNQSKSTVPYRHPGLRQFWLAGYESAVQTSEPGSDLPFHEFGEDRSTHAAG